MAQYEVKIIIPATVIKYYTVEAATREEVVDLKYSLLETESHYEIKTIQHVEDSEIDIIEVK
jgi:hypothetical protein